MLHRFYFYFFSLHVSSSHNDGKGNLKKIKNKTNCGESSLNIIHVPKSFKKFAGFNIEKIQTVYIMS